jgi:DNA polymerase-3 subunit gamma/tau
MSYLVFARKWRPKDFDEIIGQEHVTVTLKNAISLGRVAHAYLFAGPRGIGKTTCARILAKSLNCDKGPTIAPCNRCSSCLEIDEGRSMDCIEIDGASNTGVDNIRQLRENVKFSPTRGKYKIYIIDEVHMLSDAAFNALLKTLEEPPAHVKFVFATTHPHKLPSTVLSRCQRFDFRRISVSEVIQKLKKISQKEQIKIDDDALFSIAHAAEGSMRDAESILDQLVSFVKDKVTASDVNSALGLIDLDSLFGITQRIIEKDPPGALKIIDRLISEGKDPLQFLNRLIGHVRNIMVAKLGEDLKNLIDLPQAEIEKVTGQASGLSLQELFYFFYVLMNAHETMRRASPILRIPLEVAVIKLAMRDEIGSLDEILERISELEQRLSSGAACDSASTSSLPEPASVETSTASARTATETTGQSQPDLDLERIEAVWQELMDKLRVQKISAASFLEHGQPIDLRGKVLVIGFPKESQFYKESLQRQENKSLVENLLRQLLGLEIKTELVISQELKVKEEHKPKNPHDDSAIKSALKIFGAKFIHKLS